MNGSRAVVIQIVTVLLGAGLLRFVVDIISIQLGRKKMAPEVDGIVAKGAESAVLSMEKSLLAAERRIAELEKRTDVKDKRIEYLERHVAVLERQLSELAGRKADERTRTEDWPDPAPAKRTKPRRMR